MPRTRPDRPIELPPGPRPRIDGSKFFGGAVMLGDEYIDHECWQRDGVTCMACWRRDHA